MFDYADQNVIQNGLWLKKEMTVMLKQMPDAEKPIFCSVSFSFKFCGYCQESHIKNCGFSVFENIRVTVNLDRTLELL